MLLAGKPTLQLPICLEQVLFSTAIEHLGAGLMAPPRDPDAAMGRLNTLLESGPYAEAARQFASKYADFDPRQQIEEMLRRTEELLR